MNMEKIIKHIHYDDLLKRRSVKAVIAGLSLLGAFKVCCSIKYYLNKFYRHSIRKRMNLANRYG